MRVHEYQAKSILSKAGVPVPRGRAASTPEEAHEVALELGGAVVVKAQVHAGGRGKAGGVKVVSSAEEARQAAASLLGTRLVTAQTGPEGVPVGSVLVEEALQIQREMYAGMVIDGAAQGVVVMASEAGGMDIEEVAESTPDKLLRVAVDPLMGLMPHQGRSLAYGLGVNSDLVPAVAALLTNSYRVFQDNDCSLVELNPLVQTEDGRVLAADAKMSFDDDALFRHPGNRELVDPAQLDPLEARAGESSISYVKLEGNVGCMVNGAGLAMATMDVTTEAGASPANFLDVGGGADEEKVAQALKIIFSDSTVKTVLVNIFGGILRCDVVAQGILTAAGAVPEAVRPMVVRMLGTNAEEGRRMLSDSGLDVTLVDDLSGMAEALEALA